MIGHEILYKWFFLFVLTPKSAMTQQELKPTLLERNLCISTIFQQ